MRRKKFKILEKDFIDNGTKVQTLHKEKNKLKASNAEKERWIVSLEAELKRVKEEHEAKTIKLM
jgi:predicted RNase H-like nuclease (RuvC/YqgF family)